MPAIVVPIDLGSKCKFLNPDGGDLVALSHLLLYAVSVTGAWYFCRRTIVIDRRQLEPNHIHRRCRQILQRDQSSRVVP